MFGSSKPLSISKYLVGVAVIFLMVYLSYLVPLGFVTGYLVVYGVPLLVISLIFGRTIFSRATKNNKIALKLGLGLFSIMYLLGVFLSVIALIIILQYNPSVLDLLQKPNPALDVSPSVAWIMIAISMLVVGPVEEIFFRGFMFGGLLSVSKGRHWFPLAVVSALMFASVHIYYGITYGVASSVYFIQLVTFGIALAVTYYWSGGNILVLAFMHGLNNAIGFLGVATTREISLMAEGVFVGLGLVFAVLYLLKKVRINPAPSKNASNKTQILQ